MYDSDANKDALAELRRQAEAIVDEKQIVDTAYAGLSRQDLLRELSIRETELQLQARLFHRVQAELETLNEITTRLGGSLDMADVLATLETLLAEKFAIEGGIVFRYVPDRDTLHLAHSWGVPARLLAGPSAIRVDGSPWERLVRDRMALQEIDLNMSPLLSQLRLGESRPEWRDCLCLPMPVDLRVEGVLCLFSSAENAFSPAHVGFFETLARQIGIVLQNARLYTETRQAHRHLRRLTKQVVTAQEEELRLLSRELHDEAGQVLTALKLSLEMGLEDLHLLAGDEPDPADIELLRDQLLEAKRLSEQTMSHIQSLVHRLRPTALDDLGLEPALDALCRDFAGRTGVAIRFESIGSRRPSPPSNVRITLYRFLQEALSNAVRHSRATEVDVVLRADGELLSLSVVDNGVGFDPAAVSDGIGLLGIRERLESAGGRMELESAPGAGARLVAWMPWHTRAAPA